MGDINIDNLISMTALQKLSLRKLRKRTTPLFVMDFKSKCGGFVLLSMEAYEKMGKGGAIVKPESGSVSESSAASPDYRAMGLLWDRPGMSNEEFHGLLHDFQRKENAWALKRLLEYAPSKFVTRVLSLSELKSAMDRIQLKPFYQEAWSHAVHYWSENP